MKSLTLLRHAKSERESPSGEDFDRRLNDRGRADSARMGEEIRELDLGFDQVLASPARRAVETIDGVSGLQPTFDDGIYDASVGELFEIVRSTDDSVGRLLMVGHNPGFERLAALLTAGAVVDFPTAALVEIELAIDHWLEVEPGSGRLARFIKPKELA